ncbi:Smc5-Smc6 Complex Localization Factor Protein 1 [Manis pentadactyla]|nr:Smc5-Smc6 Complex Localization Factor Protein 1 [Manis pentadactyla]
MIRVLATSRSSLVLPPSSPSLSQLSGQRAGWRRTAQASSCSSLVTLERQGLFEHPPPPRQRQFRFLIKAVPHQPLITKKHLPNKSL